MSIYVDSSRAPNDPYVSNDKLTFFQMSHILSLKATVTALAGAWTMELLLSAISSGGLAGAANQYLCLIILSVVAKLGLVRLAPPVGFMTSWWFIAIVAVFWAITVLPAFGSLLSPGIMNVVNTIVNLLSGFIVPVSGALLTLASVGIIAEMHPNLYGILQTLRIFEPGGGSIGTVGWLMAGGGALTASTLTGAKFLAKPTLSSATGTAGTTSAPTYATAENIASIVLMALAYVLTQVNPWLLVGLVALIALAILATLGWSVYQLWKLGKGIGQIVRLLETDPAAGLSVVSEFLVWGSGWLIWKNWTRGTIRLVLWGAWIATILLGIPAAGTALGVALAAVPFLTILASALVVGVEVLTVTVGLYIGARSARSLMKTFERIRS